MAHPGTAALPQRLTLAEAEHSLLRLGEALQRQQPGAAVDIDASALQAFDSSALAVLLELRRRALAQGQTLNVRGWPERLKGLATLYGVGELLAS